ncbi:hypothetical protein [Granulicella sibirica]|uniref:Glycosyltransferase RgtA/B/C/D-like domain-containing protein n=1 Tax=Granulicella sibirica TaxID=2479048 RepID=A0A4V1L585_9BACT|nr:hypothetical protein [Granulicella sibirica]RXH54884.1 hypothetical protein GRAN_3988 [Granulicella sibirica]
MADTHSIPERRSRTFRLIEAAILFAAAVLFSLHFLNLEADFPNHSPWMDWSKYTDEGWYGDAAIRHFQLGHWNVPGDFNAAAALPVWPVVEGLLFRFTGVSLIAARALTVSVFGLILTASYLLLRRWKSFSGSGPGSTMMTRRSLAPALAVLLLVASPFCFVFTRLAILEPFLILLTLLALHAASSAPAPGMRGKINTIVLGLLLPAMVLTKTTAVFLFPAVAWLLWASSHYRLWPFLRSGLSALAVTAAAWSSYFLLVVRPHYLEDYRYLFSANAYTRITADTAISVLHDTVMDGLWIGELLYPLAILCLVVALVRFRWFRERPLVPTLLLWAVGYAAFLAYHNNLQPRYYLVVAIPLTLFVVLVLEPAIHLLNPAYKPTHSTPARPLLALGAMLVFTAVVVTDSIQTLDFIRNPEYTLVDAAAGVAAVVRADPSHSPLLLSISGSDISLMTGIHSICDDFGTLELADRVNQYRPGWYAAWNQIDDDKMDALSPLYHPVRVAAFPAMDDPERNLLILYRLDDKTSEPEPRRRRKPIPRSLQTKIGQQPSVNQLEH